MTEVFQLALTPDRGRTVRLSVIEHKALHLALDQAQRMMRRVAIPAAQNRVRSEARRSIRMLWPELQEGVYLEPNRHEQVSAKFLESYPLLQRSNLVGYLFPRKLEDMLRENATLYFAK